MSTVSAVSTVFTVVYSFLVFNRIEDRTVLSQRSGDPERARRGGRAEGSAVECAVFAAENFYLFLFNSIQTVALIDAILVGC